MSSLDEALRFWKLVAVKAGVGFGFSMAIIFGMYWAAFFVGGEFMRSCDCPDDPTSCPFVRGVGCGYTGSDVMMVFALFAFSAMGVGQAAQMAPKGVLLVCVCAALY